MHIAPGKIWGGAYPT